MDDIQKKFTKDKMIQNKHEVYVLDIAELDVVVRTKLGSPVKAAQKKSWDDLRRKLEFAANYTATGGDIIKLNRVFTDLGFVGTRAYVKYHKGKAYVIFKGQPGLRKIFTGTRYGLQNSKVIQMGFGKHGAIHSAKHGGILTIIVLGAYRILDYILSDQATLNQLIGTLATDVVKVGLAVGTSIAAGIATASVFTIAIGPLVVAIAVGVITSYGLTKLDEHYELTQSVIAALEELEKGIEAIIEEKKKQAIMAINDITESAIDYAIVETRRITITMAKHYFRKALPSW